MNPSSIPHIGIIQQINDDHLIVRIQQTAACGGCAAKGSCGMSAEKKEMHISIPYHGEDLRVGQTVSVSLQSQTGPLAVALGYLLPFLLLISTLLISYGLTGNEKLAAICALLSLVPYFLVLAFSKNKLKEWFRFRLG